MKILLFLLVSFLPVLSISGQLCTLGRTNPQATGPNTNPGLFIDTENPVPCSGQVMEWRVCYYNPRNFHALDEVPIRLQVWRFDQPRQNGDLMGENVFNVNIPQQPPNFQCVTMAPNQMVNVTEGDFLGVFLRSNMVLPVVGTVGPEGPTLLFVQSSALPDMPQEVDTQAPGSVPMMTNVIHVTAEIAGVTTMGPTIPDMATQPVTTPEDRGSEGGLSPGATPEDRGSEGGLSPGATPIEDRGSEGGLSPGAIAAVVIVVILLVVLAVVGTLIGLMVWVRLRSREKLVKGGPRFHVALSIDRAHEYQERLEEARKGIVSGVKEDPYYYPASDESSIYMDLKKQRIPDISGLRIKIGQNLGSGQFGTVDQATWTQSSGNSVQVAVKTLNSGASSVDRVKFLQEAAIMAQFRHPNVVTLFGVAQKNGQRMIVVELLFKGDLRKFLRNLNLDPGKQAQHSTSHLLLEFSQQICLGMSYLASKGFIHRDLAARNILLSDDNICKIADFGMSRDLQETDYYISSGGMIPVRWTAPEAIQFKKYSTASDVWSYGCVLYEIWSLGSKPFQTTSNSECLRKIQSGFRLHPPPGCPKRVYEVMMQTWSDTPSNRPEFMEILLYLLENKNVMLHIPPEAMTSHPQAGVLGAPLEAGENMYTELQNTYKV